MILHRRSQLLKWLEENAPTASIRRAVGEGSVEFLGFFGVLSGSKFPGWIIKVTSTITGIMWNVVVRQWFVQGASCEYYAWVLIEDIPWAYWNPLYSINPFMRGDRPETYRKNREDAQTDRRSTLHQEDTST